MVKSTLVDATKRRGTKHGNGAQLDRKPLGQQIADRIRDDILTAKLPSGLHLTQQDLCEQYGTSRMPARDALLQLTYEGFVIDEGAGRVRVAPLTKQSIEDLFRIEGVLHGLACRMASERAALEDIEELALISEAVKTAEDESVLIAEHQRFHRMINSLASSTKLRSAIRPLSQQIPSNLIVILPGLRERSVEMHRKVIAALHRRDGAEAERVMIEHTNSAAGSYLRYLTERQILPNP
ncbi:MAG: GntR family transcriptional regulator [Hyphomicrobiales bacterium]|nr:MAG: GntR family transcriptional regulator [Hyphomicrobiales bacterium]